jgi:hypothetical protein
MTSDASTSGSTGTLGASTEKWIDASRAPSWTHLGAFLGAAGVLVVGSFGVAYRIYWCRMPAIIALGLGVSAAVLYLRAKATKHDRSIKTVRSIYSLDYANVTQCAFAIGKDIQKTASNYERLHFAPLRLWLLLLLWIAWIFYGAVFHSGEHVHTEDSLLIDLTGVGGDTPHLLRIARLYLLALNAAASIWFDAVLPARDDVLERGGGGAADSEAVVKPLVFTMVFVVLLFFPTPDSTPQALHALQLMSRTLAYAALFLACELFDNSLRYLRWLTLYSKSTADLLAGMQMALGNVVRRPLQQPTTAVAAQQQHQQQNGALSAPPPLVVSDVMRSFNLLNTLSQWSVVLRSAWILVASAEVNYLVPLQVLFMVVLLARLRASVTANVATNTSLLRLAHSSAGAPATTPPASPTKPPPPTPTTPVVPVVSASKVESADGAKNKLRESKSSSKKSTQSPPTTAPAIPPAPQQKHRKAHVHSSDSENDNDDDDSSDSNSDPECNTNVSRRRQQQQQQQQQPQRHQIPRIGFIDERPRTMLSAPVPLIKRKDSTSASASATTAAAAAAATTSVASAPTTPTPLSTSMMMTTMTTTARKSSDLIEADSRRYAAAQITGR